MKGNCESTISLLSFLRKSYQTNYNTVNSQRISKAFIPAWIFADALFLVGEKIHTTYYSYENVDVKRSRAAVIEIRQVKICFNKHHHQRSISKTSAVCLPRIQEAIRRAWLNQSTCGKIPQAPFLSSRLGSLLSVGSDGLNGVGATGDRSCGWFYWKGPPPERSVWTVGVNGKKQRIGRM